MAGIGMNFAAQANYDALIEDTLVYASELGMEDPDFRVIGVLSTWLEIHHRYVNADRLIRALSNPSSPRVRAYWAAVAFYFTKDRRFARLHKLHQGPPLELLPIGNDFQIARRGEDPRFVNSPLKVPAGTLRTRNADVLSPDILIKRHRGYRNRVLLGPTWRADVWTVLENHPDISVAEVARRAGSSFATAWQVVQDFRLLQRATEDKSKQR